MAHFSHQTFVVAQKVTKLTKTRQRSHFTHFQLFLIWWHGQCGVEDIVKGQKCPTKYGQPVFPSQAMPLDLEIR